MPAHRDRRFFTSGTSRQSALPPVGRAKRSGLDVLPAHFVRPFVDAVNSVMAFDAILAAS